MERKSTRAQRPGHGVAHACRMGVGVLPGQTEKPQVHHVGPKGVRGVITSSSRGDCSDTTRAGVLLG